MKNVIVYLSKAEYIRNYLDTQALVSINEKFNVTVVIAPKYEEKHFTNSTLKTIEFKPNYEHIPSSTMYFEILRWRNRKLSKSFKWVENWEYQNYLKRFYGRITKVITSILLISSNRKLTLVIPEFFSGEISILFRYLKRLPRRYFIRLLALKPIYYFVKILMEKKLNYEPSIFPFLTNGEIDLVIIPGGASETIEIALISACKKLGIKTLMLLDNWDNVSSKTILWVKPDFIGTWGPQSSRAAYKIQKMDEDKVFNIGTPRFESYFDKIIKSEAEMLPENYVLFIGTVLEFNEVRCLSILNKTISQNSEIFGNMKIVYRPHPRNRANDLNKRIWPLLKNVVIDPQVANLFLGIEGDNLKHPKLDYYANLLKNAKLIIGGLSTMVIEASLLQKKYIALVHHERFSVTSPREAYTSFEHYRGIERLDNLVFCDNLKKLSKIFSIEMCREFIGNNYETNEALRDIYYRGNLSYGERLLQALEKLDF